jgi:RHH-type proline utilization regulon transcriptional repressor/proline dehydrogenase/delta 1-pyrroline-5-carboxylate dehydrogenase
MSTPELERKIIERGKEFFEAISGEAPSIFNKGWWTGKVMDWSMKDEDFKVSLFRFVDVLPCLHTSESLNRHIHEYFATESGDMPPVMKLGLKGAGVVGKLGGNFMAKAISKNIERMGRQFIIGQDAKEAVKNLHKLRKDGFAFTIDILGEATVSEAESEARMQEHLDLLESLAEVRKKFTPLGDASGELDWGGEPIINLSVKLTAFYSQSKPRDFEGTVNGILRRLIPVYRRVVEMGGAMCIDMESLDYKDITIEVYKRLRSSEEFRDYPHLALVLQTYLKCTDDDVTDMVAWARTEKLPITLRLVKGAYWDYETVRAKQQGWEVPVYTIKADSDAAYERNARTVLENSDICRLACAHHRRRYGNRQGTRRCRRQVRISGALRHGRTRAKGPARRGRARAPLLPLWRTHSRHGLSRPPFARKYLQRLLPAAELCQWRADGAAAGRPRSHGQARA